MDYRIALHLCWGYQMIHSDININQLDDHQETIIKNQNDEYKEAILKAFSNIDIDQTLTTNPQSQSDAIPNLKFLERVLSFLQDNGHL